MQILFKARKEEERKMGWEGKREGDGGIRGILRIGFTIFEKNTLPRGKR